MVEYNKRLVVSACSGTCGKADHVSHTQVVVCIMYMELKESVCKPIRGRDWTPLYSVLLS